MVLKPTSFEAWHVLCDVRSLLVIGLSLYGKQGVLYPDAV